ncbi:MAG TPA: hypothetical protein DCK93_15715 [Blastocatellia bacterium]|nr:hypothetical protein [Blastocatellia bacterium]
MVQKVRATLPRWGLYCWQKRPGTRSCHLRLRRDISGKRNEAGTDFRCRCHFRARALTSRPQSTFRLLRTKTRSRQNAMNCRQRSMRSIATIRPHMSQKDLQVVIVAGPNGAGKSTLAPVLLRDTFGLLEFVNADTISAGLSAFNAEAVALDAGRVMLTRLRELAANKQSFAFESTLATRSYAPWINFLAQEGYEFHLLFLWLNTAELAIQRVAERVRNGGHSVNEDIIRRRYSRGLDNLSQFYIPLADTWVIYDNSGTGSPLLIASGEKKRTSRVVRPELWQTVVGNRQ